LVVAATANFSASQILEAGRRAEADGNRDYALRFYRHLAGNFAGTFEAAEAVSALHRLDEAGLRPALSPPQNINGTGRTGPVYATPLLGPPGYAAPNTVAPDTHNRTAPPAARQADDTSARPPVRRQKGAARAGDPDADVPKKLPRFRFGRFLAGLLSLLGGLGAVFGLSAFAAGLFLPAARTANTVAAGVLASPLIAAAFALASLVVLLVGLVARAVFAMAMRQAHDALQKQLGDTDHDDE
jgi:hypothetical protein